MNVEEGLAALPELVRSRESVELFWFPFNDWVWIRTFDRTELPPTFHSHGLGCLVKNFIEMTVLVGTISFVSKHFPAFLPSILRRSATLLSFRQRVLPPAEALHYRRWVELRRCSCVEVGFKIDANLANVREAFRGTMRMVDEWAARGRYPLDLTINVRFTGPSRALLSPAYGPGLTCFIEALFTRRNADWKVFTSELYAMWLSDATALPHWAKECEHVPGIEALVSCL